MEVEERRLQSTHSCDDSDRIPRCRSLVSAHTDSELGILRSFAGKYLQKATMGMEKRLPSSLMAGARFCSEPLLHHGGRVLDRLDGHIDKARDAYSVKKQSLLDQSVQVSSKRVQEFLTHLRDRRIISAARHDMWQNCTTQIATELMQQGFMDCVWMYLFNPRGALAMQIACVLNAIKQAVSRYLKSVRAVLPWVVSSFFKTLELAHKIQPWVLELISDLPASVNLPAALTKDGIKNTDILDCVVDEDSDESYDAREALEKRQLTMLERMQDIAFRRLEAQPTLLGCLVQSLLSRLHQDSLLSASTYKLWRPHHDKIASVLQEKGCTNTGLLQFIAAEQLDLRKHQFVAQLSTIATQHSLNNAAAAAAVPASTAVTTATTTAGKHAQKPHSGSHSSSASRDSDSDCKRAGRGGSSGDGGKDKSALYGHTDGVPFLDFDAEEQVPTRSRRRRILIEDSPLSSSSSCTSLYTAGSESLAEGHNVVEMFGEMSP